MRRLTLISVLAALFLLFAQLMNARVKLPALVSSNMVLQRNTTVVLWGWADAKEKITIETSWLNEILKVEADLEGNWRIEVKTNNSKAPQTIKIKTKTSDITLNNVLFGEVWLCSGQSNMQQPVSGYYGQPTFGSLSAIVKSDNPNLRLFTVANVGSRTPLKDLQKYTAWQQATYENVPYFSAVAYFFGQQLQEILDVPVGMIHSSWGGSFVEAWMSKEVLGKYQKIDIGEANLEKSNSVQTALFNAMINPLIPYTIKGALWYQGESNRMAPAEYKQLFPAMVEDWRTRWGIGDFPFYYVQIAPFFYWNDSTAFSQVENSAFFREAQVECLDLIPNSGMAVTTDIGSKYCIHPPRKKEVADRLLFNALNQSYGYHSVDCNGPMYESMKVKEGGIILNFKNAEMGLYSLTDLDGFEIAGSDKVFYPAKAAIVDTTIAIAKSNRVFVKSDQVPDPVAVRYAWHNWVDGKLYDNSFLPASSFRTDNWKDAIYFKEVEFKNWAQTPPMGWNSWDCYGPTVEEHEVRSNTEYIARYLKKFGWEYVVVDIRWFVENHKLQAGIIKKTRSTSWMSMAGTCQLLTVSPRPEMIRGSGSWRTMCIRKV